MEAAHPPELRESRALVGTVTPTRELVVAALLATFGALGLFVPVAVASLGPLAFFSSGHTDGDGPTVASWSATLATLGQVPAVAVLALAAAVGLAQRDAWGRWLGVLVGAITLAALPYRLLVGVGLPVPASPGDAGVVPPTSNELIMQLERHLFVLAGAPPEYTIPLAVFGAVVLLGLLSSMTRPATSSGRESPEPPVASAAAPYPVRWIALLLGLLAVAAFGPYLAWLVEAATTIFAPAEDRADWLHGSLVLLAGLAAGGAAGVSARAVRRGSRLASYVAPPSAAVAGLWTAAWVILATAGGLAPSAAQPGSELLLLPGLLIALAGLLSFPVTLAVVVIWRIPGGAPAQPVRVAESRAARLRPRAAGLAVVVLTLPILLFGSIEAASPRPERLYYRSVGLDGRAYQFRLSIESPGDRLIRIGILDDWTPDLQIGDPAAYVIDGVGTDLAIVVAGSTTGSPPLLDFDLFVRTSADGVPQEYCQFVPLEDPFVGPGPCGPPEGILVGDRLYWADMERLVPPGDLTATAISATGTGTWRWPGDLPVFGIRDVDPTTAVALRFGERVLVYRADGSDLATGHPLCAYPTLTDERDRACMGDDPFFQLVIEVDGRKYLFDIDSDLYDIPADVLDPHRDAVAIEGELPQGMDATAYRIQGVEPGDAVGLIFDKRVRVARPVESERFPLPSGLCPFIVREAFEELLKGTDIETGCPSS